MSIPFALVSELPSGNLSHYVQSREVYDLKGFNGKTRERERERQTERQTDRQTDRDRQRQRQRDRKTERQRETDSQTDRQTDRQRGTGKPKQEDRIMTH